MGVGIQVVTVVELGAVKVAVTQYSVPVQAAPPPHPAGHAAAAVEVIRLVNGRLSADKHEDVHDRATWEINRANGFRKCIVVV